MPGSERNTLSFYFISFHSIPFMINSIFITFHANFKLDFEYSKQVFFFWTTNILSKQKRSKTE